MNKTASIVVTRAEGVDGPLTQLLMRAGQRVLHWQVTAIAETSDPAALRTAMQHLDDYDWIVVTSGATVDAMEHAGAKPPKHARVAAVGTATATRLRKAGWPVDLVPAQSSAEHLVAALQEQTHKARRVLFPASASALPTLPRQLRQAGIEVDQIEAYRLADVAAPAETWRAALAQNTVDAVTFASPSAVDRLHDVLGAQAFGRISNLVATAIGATTADALRRHGLTATAIAKPSTLESLADVTLAALAAKTAERAPVQKV